MKIALICSNSIPVNKQAKKGTEIFVDSFLSSLSKVASQQNIDVTVFSSGDSTVPFKTESIAPSATSLDPSMPDDKHIIFELALLSKAFSMQDDFDLYHINIGDGDIAVPFAPFINKPIIITIHHLHNLDYVKSYFSLFKNNPNILFISASNAQRNVLPGVNYLHTIYHGIDSDVFQFDEIGGENIMWASRAIPEKGPDTVINVAQFLQKPAKLFGIKKKGFENWLDTKVLNLIGQDDRLISFVLGKTRYELIEHYMKSKLFLFPVTAEEAFGFVIAESMSCGTPVVAYAKGSIPEIIKDGVTGFIVNESDNDIRGDWVIKKTGIEGLKEAVEKIYAMPDEQYRKMRIACREHVEQNFTIDVMTQNYIQAYKEVLSSGGYKSGKESTGL